MFNPAVDAAAKAHALAAYPNECCGVVQGPIEAAHYVALDNVAPDPAEQFTLPPRALIDHAPVLAVIHSHCHPRHDGVPSAADMAAQIECALPFAIIWTDGSAAGAPLWFGDFLLDVPLFDGNGIHKPREFVHGVTDCYALIRCWFWQLKKIKLPEFPRDKDWWTQGPDSRGGNLYEDGVARAGFARIEASAAQPGDVVLMKWGPWKVPFHGGVLLPSGLILHHLQKRLSRREPFARWAMKVTHYCRYQGS